MVAEPSAIDSTSVPLFDMSDFGWIFPNEDSIRAIHYCIGDDDSGTSMVDSIREHDYIIYIFFFSL